MASMPEMMGHHLIILGFKPCMWPHLHWLSLLTVLCLCKCLIFTLSFLKCGYLGLCLVLCVCVYVCTHISAHAFFALRRLSDIRFYISVLSDIQEDPRKILCVWVHVCMHGIIYIIFTSLYVICRFCRVFCSAHESEWCILENLLASSWELKK